MKQSKLNIANGIARKSKLIQKDIDELDKLVKNQIAKNHGLVKRLWKS